MLKPVNLLGHAETFHELGEPGTIVTSDGTAGRWRAERCSIPMPHSNVGEGERVCISSAGRMLHLEITRHGRHKGAH